MSAPAERLRKSAAARYLSAVAAVVAALVLRLLVEPLIGSGARFALFFAAVLVVSLFVGVGPGVVALGLSLALAAYLSVVRAGTPVSQAALQALLYAVDGVIILFVAALVTKRRRSLDDVNRELRRLHDEAARAEVHARQIIELAPDAFFLADLEARLTDVNSAALELLGYRRDDLLGKTIFDIIPAEDAQRLKEVRNQLLAPGAIQRGEWTLKRKDGAMVPVDVSANILSDGRWQAFIRDITEERRVADEREHLLANERTARRDLESAIALLRESEERFRLAVDEAPIGMALVSLDGHFVRVNHVLCEITGYGPAELMKLRFQDITHPDDLNTDVELSRRLARGDIPRYHLDKRFIRKDGSIVDITLSGSMMRAPDGTPLYYIAQIEDITARKHAEHSLRLSEAKFSGIVSIAADAIITVDRDQHITIFNEGAEQIFGYAKAEMIGADLDRLIPERFRARHHEEFARFAAGPENARKMGERREVYGLRSGGEEFPADASISKVTVGEETFFSVVLRDITDRKKVEEALRRAVAARDDVLRVVAHDLRNPLSAIMMEAQILEDPESEALRRDLQPGRMILRSAKRMNHLIDDLLDVALVEAGQLKVERTRLSAADLAREAVESQTTLATSSEIEIRLEIAPEVHELWGDHKRLLQVFENLIGNAIKFSEPGDRIVVSARVENDDVLFAVADTGSGIDPTSLRHVFDPFWQAATRARRLGAGLGLPLTKGIVEAHGGRIWVESDPGRGSTFFFTVPTSERVAEARPAATSQTSPVSAPSGDGQPHPPMPRQGRHPA